MAGNDDALPDDNSLADGQVPLEQEVVFGRYRLCYELGAGGMATVYLGRVDGPGGFAKAVAIERIHPHLARRKDFVAMFLDEARIASRVSHPNICSAFDFGEVDGVYFMAMEYLVGEPLSNVETVLERRQELYGTERWNLIVARIVADLCEGLHAAHELRDEAGRHLAIVHRDVSPHNAFVTYDGAVKLVDFGIALSKDRITQTSTGTVKGKYSYMSPEQLSGGMMDRRVDIWALGVMTWELLTGERLFRRRSDGETLLAIQSYTPPPPSMVRPGIPLELDLIVQHALEREPDARHATARDMGRALTSWIARSGHHVGMPEVSELMAELFARRRPEKLEALGVMLEGSGPRSYRSAGVAALRHPQADAATDIRPVAGASSPFAAYAEPPPQREASAGPVPSPTAEAPAKPTPWIAIAASLAVIGVAILAGFVVWAGVFTHPEEVVTAAPLGAADVPIVLPQAHPGLAVVAPVDASTRITFIDHVDAGARAGAGASEDAGTRRVAPRIATPLRPMREVALLCDTWADVTENGHALGRTPAIAHVREGMHTLRFHTNDGHDLTVSVEVGSAPRTRVHCRGR